MQRKGIDTRQGFFFERRAAVRYKWSGVKRASGLGGTEGGIVRNITGSRLGK